MDKVDDGAKYPEEHPREGWVTDSQPWLFPHLGVRWLVTGGKPPEDRPKPKKTTSWDKTMGFEKPNLSN
jgi:hypothetical protein